MPRRTTSLLAALLVGASLSACGSGEDDPVVQAPPPSPPACTTQAPTTPAPPGATTDLAIKPVIAAPTTPPPCDLQVADVVTGRGAPIQPGDSLQVKYVGVLHDGAQQFDASWDRGADETFDFQLGAGMAIEGWDEGLVGMQPGGRRQLTIPPGKGYGPEGSPPRIPGGATLVFVVDLVKVGA